MTAPQILLETAADKAAADALIERAFGPGRLVKVSERVREIARFRPDLSFAAFQGDVLTGSVRLWDIAVGGAPLVFLGPLAVESGARNAGTGAALVNRACEAAAASGAAARRSAASWRTEPSGANTAARSTKPPSGSEPA